MTQYLQIKCPFCGAILRIKQQPGLEKAFVTCSVCKKKSAFTDFKMVAMPNQHNDESTQLPGSFNSQTNSEATEVGNLHAGIIGSLVEKSGKRWTLHPGVNTIGRKQATPPQQSEVSILDFTNEHRMSRRQAKIEVVRLPNGSYKHILSNWLNPNPTYVGGEPIGKDDKIVLHSGMVITFANIPVTFEIEDSDETTY